MIGFMRRTFPVWFALLALSAPVAGAFACPFCTMQGQTLTGEVGQATLVLYGTLGKADQEANNGEGSTELMIDTVVKDNEILAGRKSVTLPRYVPDAGGGKYKYLVFCDVFKGKLDPYRGLAVKADSDMPRYLKGALELKDAKVGKRLSFFFDFLDNADIEISNDAYKEFGNADYKDYREMAKDLPADRIAKWLTEKETAGYRIGLYASMLGHCGKEKHAQLLRSLLDDPEKRSGSGVDGILAGYIMLKPKEGWDYTRAILKDSRKEFLLRYAALRTVRFLWDLRPDLVEQKALKDGVVDLLDERDIADLAIEDLRKWQCWDMTERILGLRGKPPYEIPIVRRAILRFALTCPNIAQATKYVAEQRQKDPQAVADAEELLKLEQEAAKPAKPSK
jgi:hypothetical protein